jgi:hypothetical protein
MKKITTLTILIWCVASLLNAQIKLHPNNVVDIGNTNAPLIKATPISNTVQIGNPNSIVNIGNSPSASLIKANSTNGTVQIGNTTGALFDAKTLFEVNVPKAVIKAIDYGWGVHDGFQFYSARDTTNIGLFWPPLFLVQDIAVFSGLSNMRANIGRSYNQMNKIFSKEYYSAGSYLGIIASSDAKLKTNIRELSSMTERISKLRPVVYDFVRDGSGRDVSKDVTYQNRVGFIAQEVGELFPDLVVAVGDEKDMVLSIDYAGLIPYLTKTIQEQTIAIREQREMIEKLQQQISFAATFDIDMPNNAPSKTTQQANVEESNSLFQNVPNPFNSVTTVNYRLGDNVKNAKICIYNLTGKQLQCHNLPVTSGENAVEVRASSLQSGMYLYSLIVDGRLIDTKRMILTE